MTSSVLPRRRTRAAPMGFAAAAVVGGMIAAAPAAATFPGANGKIAGDVITALPDGFAVNVHTIDPDGQNATPLTADGANVRNQAPEWSPDGARIAFQSSRDSDINNLQIHIMDAGGGNRVNTGVTGRTPAWSPDGTKLAFVLGGGIWTVSVDANGVAGPPTMLTVLNLGLSFPDWSPDGSTIVARLSTGLVLVDSTTGVVTPLVTDDATIANPEWSADGSKVYYHRNDSQGSSDVWSADPNPASPNPTQLTVAAGFDGAPAPAPNGSTVAFADIDELRTMDPDGQNNVPVTASKLRSLDWQPIERPDLEPLTATKTAAPSYTKLHRWEITKTPNRQVFYNHDKKHVAVDYTVRATKKNGGARNVEVNGAIAITNPNDAAVELGPITDTLPGSSCAVALSPASIAANATITIPYTCTFPNQVPADGLTNTATVNFGEGESTQATAPVNFATANVTARHHAVKVIDRLGDGPTKVLAATLTRSKSFTYRRYLKAPAKPSCIYHPNTARVIGLAPNGEIERQADNAMKVLAKATAKVRVCQKAPKPPSSEDPRPPSGSEDPPKVIITPGSSEDPKGGKPKPRPAVVKPSSEDPKPGVNKKAKLRLRQSARLRTMRLGQRNVLTLRVRNTGKSTARNVVIREKLPRQLRALKTSKPNKSTLRGNRIVIKLGALRPGKAKTVRVVVAAVGKPALTKKVKLQAARIKNDRIATRMRYRARKGLACATAKVRARNARSRTAGVCVKIRNGTPRPEISVEDREGATPR